MHASMMVHGVHAAPAKKLFADAMLAEAPLLLVRSGCRYLLHWYMQQREKHMRVSCRKCKAGPC